MRLAWIEGHELVVASLVSGRRWTWVIDAVFLIIIIAILSKKLVWVPCLLGPEEIVNLTRLTLALTVLVTLHVLAVLTPHLLQSRRLR